MAKKQNVYDKVSYDILGEEINEIIMYLSSETTESLKDSTHIRTTPTGGLQPSITVKIEAKIETQLITIESCTKILKSLLSDKGLSDFVKLGIESLTNKLKEIQEYYSKRPISSITDRMLKLPFGKGKTVELLAQSKEDQIKYRTKVSEKMLKLLPLIQELNDMKEAIQVKGGYDIPHRMKLKRNA